MNISVLTFLCLKVSGATPQALASTGATLVLSSVITWQNLLGHQLARDGVKIKWTE